MGEEFEDKIRAKFGVMPFKDSRGNLCLAGKGVSHSYEYTEGLEKTIKHQQEIIDKLKECIENIAMSTTENDISGYILKTLKQIEEMEELK